MCLCLCVMYLLACVSEMCGGLCLFCVIVSVCVCVCFVSKQLYVSVRFFDCMYAYVFVCVCVIMWLCVFV